MFRKFIKTSIYWVIPITIACLFITPAECATKNCIAGFSASASTGSVTYTNRNDTTNSSGMIEVVLTSDGSGDAVVTTSRLYGLLEMVIYDPGIGSSSPTDNYDMLIQDGWGVTLAGGTTNDLDQTAASYEVPKATSTVGGGTISLGYEKFRLNTPLTITGDAMGATREAKVILILSDYR